MRREEHHPSVMLLVIHGNDIAVIQQLCLLCRLQSYVCHYHNTDKKNHVSANIVIGLVWVEAEVPVNLR